MLQTLCFSPQIFNFKKRDWHTVTVKEHNVEARKDQAESCQDKSTCPCVVDQVKTTGLADGEEHHVTELSCRALHASTAGPPGCHCRPML